MKKLVPLFFILLCCVFASAQKSKIQSGKRFSGLDTALEKLLKDWNAVAETLFVFVPGQPEFETIALGDHTFKLKVLEGYSVKFDIADNKVTGMSFVQPNGTFKAKRK